MFQHRKRILFVSALLVFAFGLVLFVRPRNEPQYQGRYLSEWMKDLIPQPNSANAKVEAAARRAIEEIGTNGLPTYLAWLSREPPPWKKSVFSKLPLRLKQNRWLADWLVLSGNRRQQLAIQGFVILGTNAAAAIPELSSLMRNRTNANLCSQASFAPASIGPASIPALRSAFADSQQINREKIFSSIMMLSIHQGSKECLPIITAALEDVNPVVRALATNCFKWKLGDNILADP